MQLFMSYLMGKGFLKYAKSHILVTGMKKNSKYQAILIDWNIIAFIEDLVSYSTHIGNVKLFSNFNKY